LSVEEVTAERPSRVLQVAIVGVGGAGNSLLSQAINQGVSPKNCVAVNTDRSQLSESQAQNKVLLSESAGNNRIRSADGPANFQLLAHRVAPFTQESDFTILLTGLGGVTGTSAAPLIAQLNRNQVRPVVSVVALPFIHERERRFMALRGLKKMVEACDCTVVIDNAAEFRRSSDSECAADETAGFAVRGLSDVVGIGRPLVSQRILSILSLGQVATVCIAPVSSNDRVQSDVIDALRMPSANLPLTKAKGAVMLFRGVEPLSAGEATHAYEAVSSLVGHEVEFVHVSTRSAATSSLAVFLTGYSYGMALGAFVDLIEDLYDMEYGIESGPAEIGLPLRLYQMEGP
jgi:cell division protein FtsZ